MKRQRLTIPRDGWQYRSQPRRAPRDFLTLAQPANSGARCLHQSPRAIPKTRCALSVNSKKVLFLENPKNARYAGKYGDQGWIRYNRHNSGANYIYADGHAEFSRWSQIRADHYPDHRVRTPLTNPPK